jgi:hypothetical protein
MLYPSEVNLSDDSSAPTEFHFSAPVYLESNKSYALVLKPTGGNPNYTVFTATLGDADLLTGNPIIHTPYTGNFYISSNDLGWSMVQNKRLKFKLFRCDFDIESDGNLYLENSPVEILQINDMQSFNQSAEPIYGETRITVSGVSGTPAIGDVVTGGTSGATGEVIHIDTSVTPYIYYLKDVPIDKSFEGFGGEALSFSGGASAVSNTVSIPKAFREFSQSYSDTKTGVMILNKTALSNSTFNTSTLRHGEQLKSRYTGNTATVITETVNPNYKFKV